MYNNVVTMFACDYIPLMFVSFTTSIGVPEKSFGNFCSVLRPLAVAQCNSGAFKCIMSQEV